jgi:hypothetical protein
LEKIEATYYNDKFDAPIKVPYCGSCALFRWKRRKSRSRSRCKCGVRQKTSRFLLPLIFNAFTSKQHSGKRNYRLDARDLSAFSKYREEMKEQLRNNENFFRDRFLDALRRYPALEKRGFRIRIVIDIKKKGIKVIGVVLEGDEDFKKEEKKLKINVVLEFKAQYRHSHVCFDVRRHVSLSKEELLEMEHEMSKGVLERDGAYEIADALSDFKPKRDTTWRMSREFYNKVGRPRPRCKLIAKLFGS